MLRLLYFLPLQIQRHYTTFFPHLFANPPLTTLDTLIQADIIHDLHGVAHGELLVCARPLHDQTHNVAGDDDVEERMVKQKSNIKLEREIKRDRDDDDGPIDLTDDSPLAAKRQKRQEVAGQRVMVDLIDD